MEYRYEKLTAQNVRARMMYCILKLMLEADTFIGDAKHAEEKITNKIGIAGVGEGGPRV